MALPKLQWCSTPANYIALVSSDDDDLLDDILAHGQQPLTSSPNDSLLYRISTSIPGDEEILL
jgi:hypothetical protein